MTVMVCFASFLRGICLSLFARLESQNSVWTASSAPSARIDPFFDNRSVEFPRLAVSRSGDDGVFWDLPSPHHFGYPGGRDNFPQCVLEGVSV